MANSHFAAVRSLQLGIHMFGPASITVKLPPFKQLMVQTTYLWVAQILTASSDDVKLPPCLGSGSSSDGRLGNSNPKPQAPLAEMIDDRLAWLFL